MYLMMLLISHTISDFIIQGDETIKNKAGFKGKGYVSHFIGLLITSIPIFMLVKVNSIPEIFIRTIVVIIIHLLFDYIKEKIKIGKFARRKNEVKKTILFVADQLLHILVIILIGKNVSVEFNYLNNIIIERVLTSNAIVYGQVKAAFIILYTAFSGSYLVPLILGILYKNIPDYGKVMDGLLKDHYKFNDEESKFIDEVKTGKWIGILERLLMSSALVIKEIQLVGFILAAKSLARYKLMDNKIFSEYFLIGTFLSVIYTFCAYGLLNTLF